MLQADAISFSRGAKLVLDQVDLTANTGQTVGVLGPNGSGKTTLLRLLYHALKPTEGSVTVDGNPIAGLTRPQVARRIAVVAQEPDAEMPITVEDSVMLGRLPHRSSLARPREYDHTMVETALNHVHASHLTQRLMSRLSGGERQRVLIARAIAQDASHLLLDEPTNHLDIRFQHETLNIVRGLRSTTVVTLHDLNLAAQYCDTVVLLDHGQVVASGTPDHVLTASRLKSVYDVEVRRFSLDNHLHLAFLPHHPTSAPTCNTSD